MQAVLLAAGRGTRMGDLVKDIPKPMLKVGGKTLIEHKLAILPDEIDEIVIVIGYLGSVIREQYGNSYGGKRITYVEQENTVAGTADALWCAQDVLTGRFLVMMGDDIYAAPDIAACLKQEWALLVEEVNDTRDSGRVICDKNGHIIDVIEGRHSGRWLANLGMYVFDTRLFAHLMIPKAPGSHEYGLPQTALRASRFLNVSFVAVPATQWIQITTPEDLMYAEKQLAHGGR